MARVAQRGLFWQVYLTLLASVLLVAVFGATLWHLSVIGVLGPIARGPLRPMRGGGVHVLALLLTVAALVGFIAFPVMARITRRLEALRLSVEAWGGGDVSRRARIEGRDEIAAVAASFNGAADRVEALLTAHKSLLAHASHELRSPLARLTLATEMFLAAPAADLLPAINREIAELDGLVEEILLASRLDSDPGRHEKEQVDLLALAAEECARSAVDLVHISDSSGAFLVAGSARLLRRMIRNLLENAAKHGAAPVEVALERRTDQPTYTILLTVRDHGEGILETLRERVFEPFYRPAGWPEGEGSWGLGLSLVRQIARQHGGEAMCRAEDGATVFAVELPMAGAKCA